MLVTPYLFGENTSMFWKAPYFTLVLELVIFGLLIAVVIYLKRARTRSLTPEEKAKIIEKYNPEPLVPEVKLNHPALKERIVSGKVGKRITIDGQDCLNLGSHNYLGLLGDEEIQNKAIESLRKYGVGSCGPRGFYGTIDVHLELEERLAKYMHCEEAVVYSYAFSTIASAIPAYAKKEDIIFVDEEVHFAIQKGLDASRAKIYYFKHNDVADLEDKLKQHELVERKDPKKQYKKFIIVEGIYLNTGEMCPLPEIVALRRKYKCRLFLDETVSFGTIGKTGRGLIEHYNVDKIEVDLLSSSLEHAVGSIGGFCVGTTFVIEHQRLSGLGYCFSASLPPLLTQAAIVALDKFEAEPKMFEQLQDVAEKLHNKLSQLKTLKVRGHPLSPVKHLYLATETVSDYETEYGILSDIVDECIKNKLGLTVSSYLESKERKKPRSSIRVAVNRLLTNDDIKFTYDVLTKATKKIIG